MSVCLLWENMGCTLYKVGTGARSNLGIHYLYNIDFQNFAVLKPAFQCFLKPSPAEPGYALPLHTVYFQLIWIYTD